MNIRKFLYDFYNLREFCPGGGLYDRQIPPAKEYGKIKKEELIELLPNTYIRNSGGIGTVRKADFWDEEYILTSVEEIQRWLNHNKIDTIAYNIDGFNCNHYAVATWGCANIWTPIICLGLGIKWKHAKNWFVDADKKLWELEGMNDGIKLRYSEFSEYKI